MIEMKNYIEIKTYLFQDNNQGTYLIDITSSPTDNHHEAWLYNNEYGIKHMMFGCRTKTLEEFIDLVEGNAEDYIKIYREEVEDECQEQYL